MFKPTSVIGSVVAIAPLAMREGEDVHHRYRHWFVGAMLLNSPGSGPDSSKPIYPVCHGDMVVCEDGAERSDVFELCYLGNLSQKWIGVHQVGSP